jgi:hypothetical protein
MNLVLKFLEHSVRVMGTWIGLHTLLGNVISVVAFGAFVGEAAGAGDTIAGEVEVFVGVWG